MNLPSNSYETNIVYYYTICITRTALTTNVVNTPVLNLPFVPGNVTHFHDVFSTEGLMFVKLNLSTVVQQNFSAAFTSTTAGRLCSAPLTIGTGLRYCRCFIINHISVFTYVTLILSVNSTHALHNESMFTLLNILLLQKKHIGDWLKNSVSPHCQKTLLLFRFSMASHQTVLLSSGLLSRSKIGSW